MSNPIVIVEDDESIRTMLEYYFKSLNYNVMAFESGEALFDVLGDTVPQLCILDIMLRTFTLMMDGYSSMMKKS